MNVLLIGSGGREHALAYALVKSKRLNKLFAAPGNPGIGQLAEIANLKISDHAAVIAFCRDQQIGFVVVGPEAPLVAGLVDDLKAAGIPAFGPTKFAAQLEGSKGFTKDLCAKYNIPTAAYERFKAEAPALAYLKKMGAPIVVKADGLAAGKGVTVAMTLAESEAAVKEIFAGRFGEGECVIEEFLEGEEASFFVLTDGVDVLPLTTAQDHKRVGEGDTGPNTGGMGAYSPAPCMTNALCDEALEKIVKPTVKGLAEMGHPYTGVLYAGLILTAQGPKLIEYNARFGDPETQVLMIRLESDLIDLLLATTNSTLKGKVAAWKKQPALTVVVAANGYPGDVQKGSPINGLNQDFEKGVEVFHAGTALDGEALVSNGGRVLNVTATGDDIRSAQAKAYRVVDAINWTDGFCRRDIGWRALEK
ncbi:phosphoribosylamine--glycine ligase [Aestuariivirga litoralis]|uniref:phosphoribosylamine--glycine ligase n=1 Tax=Aestuariivirga litoralis TaxID=2650924 RepID=UPI0018C78B50|nr:phosphoribosylamine--glycine ligase [Aestuariivirga litoralis]MBG1232091.1 phosphoribosylamine--glycine ligase [Aestuariivirga litoralis]